MDMKKWNLVPGKSIGPLEFGMDRASVRELIGEKFKPFKKSLFSKSLSDSYKSFHVYYSKEGVLIAIEFFDGVEITLDGQKIFPGNFEKARSSIKGLNEQSGIYISKSMSVGITLSDADGIETLLVGCKGYYD